VKIAEFEQQLHRLATAYPSLIRVNETTNLAPLKIMQEVVWKQAHDVPVSAFADIVDAALIKAGRFAPPIGDLVEPLREYRRAARTADPGALESKRVQLLQWIFRATNQMEVSPKNVDEFRARALQVLVHFDAKTLAALPYLVDVHAAYLYLFDRMSFTLDDLKDPTQLEPAPKTGKDLAAEPDPVVDDLGF